MEQKILGAIIGDVVGSRFEFNNIKTKEFALLSSHSRPTDDSIMTLAVMDMCVNNRFDREGIIQTFKKWGKAYPNAGYGYNFYSWVLTDDPNPYYSCGNGSAMRISPVAYVANSVEETIKLAKKVTEVTHNHPEGIKGAVVTAVCVYMALHGSSKEEIVKYAIRNYPEIKDLDYEELRRTYKHEAEICQCTLPQALYCFMISNSFEDCLRTTISIGGDCDTTSAISCAIAGAFYGVPEDISYGVEKILDDKQNQMNLAFVNKFIYNKEN